MTQFLRKMDPESNKIILRLQQTEIDEHLLYKNLVSLAKGKNKKILEQFSKDELRHYNLWKTHTKKELSPNKFKILRYRLLSRLFGLTFILKLFERGEGLVQGQYEKILNKFPEARIALEEENKHEAALIKMIDEERLNYLGSTVLGLNDALVELTGALAGLTFALQNTKLVGIAGLITGIAASLSMGASEYISKKSDSAGKSPIKAAFYTGVPYFITVLFLVFPYFIFSSYSISLSLTLLIAILIVGFTSYFISVIKELKFKRLFTEMAVLSLGIAAISFMIGAALRTFFGIEV